MQMLLKIIESALSGHSRKQERYCWRKSRNAFHNSRLDKAEKAETIRAHILQDERQTTSEDSNAKK